MKSFLEALLIRVILPAVVGTLFALGLYAYIGHSEATPVIAKFSDESLNLDGRPTMRGKRFEVISREEIDQNVIAITFKDKRTGKHWMLVYTTQLFPMERVE
jgi:hypothetical protein